MFSVCGQCMGVGQLLVCLVVGGWSWVDCWLVVEVGTRCRMATITKFGVYEDLRR